MTQAHDDQTLHFYSSFAPTYIASGPGGASRHLPEFLANLRPNSRILELGCGGGRDAQAMIAAGHHVDPTDGVPEIARKAEALLQRPVRVMRFEDLDAQDAYDAVWANASLLHVARPALPGILGKIRNALRPGGLHHATYKAGGQEGRDRQGRYFNYLSSEQASEMYERAGPWSSVKVTEYLGGGYEAGGQMPWVAVMARKPA